MQIDDGRRRASGRGGGLQSGFAAGAISRLDAGYRRVARSYQQAHEHDPGTPHARTRRWARKPVTRKSLLPACRGPPRPAVHRSWICNRHRLLSQNHTHRRCSCGRLQDAGRLEPGCFKEIPFPVLSLCLSPCRRLLPLHLSSQLVPCEVIDS